MDNYSGKKLDNRYEIQDFIGAGGMAQVYKAYDIINDRIVAIKILKDEFLRNPEFLRRFRNESKAIAVMSHPNIVKVYDVSFGDRMQYIVMEYIDGITLKEYIERQGVVKWREALHFTVQILRALQHAHEKGIVHRDIKPQNIILLQDGTIKVTDFGIARFAQSETRTMTDKVIGSVHYIAPEQARGDITDAKADIYSIGVMLYEMITGELPFEADSAVSVAIMQLQNEPQSPRKINPEIPEALEEITLKAMRKNPKQRYQSAAEMLNDVDVFRKNPNIRFDYNYLDLTETNQFSSRNSNTTEFNKHAKDDMLEDELMELNEKNKNKTVLILVVVAFVLSAMIIAVWKLGIFSSDKEVEVPDFVGMKYTDILREKDAGEYRFNFEKEDGLDWQEDEGVVLDQSIKPGNLGKIKENATIKLKVNSKKNKVQVPDVSELDPKEAKQRLKLEGLRIGKEESEYNDSIKSGLVIRTNPEKDKITDKGKEIKLIISKGPEIKEINLPNLVGLSLAEAKKKISEANLKVGNIAHEDSKEDADVVISSSPSAGSTIKEGQYVNLVVSNGRKKETSMDVSFEGPKSLSKDFKVQVYVDGELIETKTVDFSINPKFSMSIKGSGQKKVVIKLDGIEYYRTTLDFDTKKQTESYSDSFRDYKNN